MNRLAEETSPYLQQHKENPVDWYPWGDDAFRRAREEDKPLLVSVGYSACHWCHVMAHESFEDPATAVVMNELFVNVKVDREERPDVDAIYMDAVQAMTGHGGWPMTVFLTPEGEPFYGGTYFPKEGRGGLPAFTDLLYAVADAWKNRRGELQQQAGKLAGYIRDHSALAADPSAAVNRELLDGAYRMLRASHDNQWGGFGRAPKFPQTTMLELLLRAYAHNGSDDTLAMVSTTLDAMASGGIYDHLGGGFHRYSVDAHWLVPHFEKMLYDQALLARAYLRAWKATGHGRWLQVVEETVAYVLRDLRSPEGGLYSAEDADSEGVEGKFYVWRPDELDELLGDRAAAAIAWYGVTDEGNFEGSNILYRPQRGDLLRPPEIEEARRRLFEGREQRVRPGLDDKVLTEWSAMFVATLAEAGAAAGRTDWLDAAVLTGEFLLGNLRRDDGRWLRSWQGGRARHLAYAADYAWLVDAFTRLGEATGRARWVEAADQAAAALLDLFWDSEHEGLFTTGRDAERLIVRSKETYDGATPSANSVAAIALLRLGTLLGNEEYTARAEAILRLLAEPMGEQPTAFTNFLAAVDMVTSGLTEVVVTGDRPDLVAAVHSLYLPDAVVAWGEPYPSPLWEGRQPGRAYVCRDYTCLAPASDLEGLRHQLNRS